MQNYSVLMALYVKEKPEFLSQAIESMLNQTVKADEIVIVKDGKLSEELEKVLKEYEEANPNLFKIVGYDKNRGLGLALNYGLNYCKNEYIARMDTDDISKPSRCEKQLDELKKYPELAIVGSYIDEFENTIDNIISVRKVPLEHNEIYSFAKKRSAFNHPVVMYKKSSVLKNGGYSNLKRNQDVDLFGRMLFNGEKAKNIPESLLFFRTSSDLNKRRKSWENTKSYISTIFKFWKMGYSSFSDFLIILIAQLGMFLLPSKLQNIIYKYFLRR